MPLGSGPTGITSRPPIASCALQRLAAPPGRRRRRGWRRTAPPRASPGCRRRRAPRCCRIPARASAAARAVGQGGMPLDRVDPAGDPRSSRRRHSPSRRRSPARGRRASTSAASIMQRDDVGLRDRLAFADRQRRILVGELLEAGSTKASRGTCRIASSTWRSRTPRRLIWTSTILLRARDWPGIGLSSRLKRPCHGNVSARRWFAAQEVLDMAAKKQRTARTVVGRGHRAQ